MNLILRQVIGEARGKKLARTAPNPELAQVKKDLNSILNKWKFGEQPIRTAREFLKKFEPWIDSQLKAQKDLKIFLSKWASTNLNQLETTWKDLEKTYQEQIKQLETEKAELLKKD
jgi:hypothetical protein